MVTSLHWGRLLQLLAALLLAGTAGGCAALTNPTAAGIPVRRVPPELLGRPREEAQIIPLPLLRQPPPDAYRLATGDVLGVWIEGVLGEKNQAPPVHVVEQGPAQTAVGFPIPVREDGTISLPFIRPLSVADKTVAEAQEAVRKAYTADKEILKEQARILVELQRPRRYRVLVIRQDAGGVTVGTTGTLGGSKRGTGFQLELPAYENDVLTALARTGGFPGLDSRDEVIIERGVARSATDLDALAQALPCCPPGQRLGGGRAGVQMIRIPLRLRPEEPVPFRPEDVILQNGDIIYIESRDTDVFYTAGLLGSGQYQLPRDLDLDVVDAVCFVKGPLVSGGLGQNNLTGAILQSGLGFPSPSLISIIRHTANGGQVTIRVDLNRALVDARERILIQPKDTIILQETPSEAFVRYASTVIKFNLLATLLNQRDAVATGAVALP
jgi:protein involved in polysaccharide export with SLBB domain